MSARRLQSARFTEWALRALLWGYTLLISPITCISLLPCLHNSEAQLQCYELKCAIVLRRWGIQSNELFHRNRQLQMARCSLCSLNSEAILPLSLPKKSVPRVGSTEASTTEMKSIPGLETSTLATEQVSWQAAMLRAQSEYPGSICPSLDGLSQRSAA